MAINSVLRHLPLILFCLTLLTTVSPKLTASYFLDPQETPVTTTTTTVPPLPANTTSIIFAVISAGNFQNWATFLSENPSLLPRNFTLFLPSYNQDSIFYQYHKNYSSYFLLQYHIVPIRPSFSELCRFSPDTRLLTLLPYYTLVITNNNNKSINHSVSCSICIHGSCIIRPNIYQDESSFIHGVGSAFDYINYSEDITGKNSISWSKLWREIWVFLSVLGVYWIIFFNPFQLLPIRNDDDNDGAILEALQRIGEILDLLDLERMEDEERQRKAIEDDEDERRRERDERERKEDEEHDEELRRQYEIDEIRYFQEFDD